MTTIDLKARCSPTRCSAGSTSGRPCTTGRTASSTRTSTSCGPAATCVALPADMGGGGLDPRRGEPAAAPARLPRPGDGARGQHAHLLGGRWPPTCGAWGDRAATGSCAAAGGHVLAAGHGEAGNDVPVLLSSGTAERVDGGWEITGPQDVRQPHPRVDLPGRARHGHSDPTRPQVVHGFLPATPPATTSRRPGTCSACGRPPPRTRCSTAPSSPTATS